MEHNDYHDFMELLRNTPVTSHEFRMLRWQAISGDIEGADEKLKKIIERRSKNV